MLNDDLALDYDIGGLAVSATFVINVAVFLVVLYQTASDGFAALMEPPGTPSVPLLSPPLYLSLSPSLFLPLH